MTETRYVLVSALFARQRGVSSWYDHAPGQRSRRGELCVGDWVRQWPVALPTRTSLLNEVAVQLMSKNGGQRMRC